MNWYDTITGVWPVGERVTVDDLLNRIHPTTDYTLSTMYRARIRKTIRTMHKFGMVEHIGDIKWTKIWVRLK